MYQLSDQQLDWMLDDIRRRGIETEDLQVNLLDHISCIIENELEENGDFGQFYSTVITRFYKRELMEVEEETQSLLLFKNYYAMKKIMFIICYLFRNFNNFTIGLKEKMTDSLIAYKQFFNNSMWRILIGCFLLECISLLGIWF